MAISPVCLVLLGALCLANAAPTPAQPDLVSVARYLYESLSQAQAQQYWGNGNINNGSGTNAYQVSHIGQNNQGNIGK